MNLKNKLIIIGVFIIHLVTCLADTNDLSFEIHFDPTKTKRVNGTNYYGIDYLLVNNGTRPLGRAIDVITFYTIDSSGREKEIYPPIEALSGSFKTPPLLEKGEIWKGVIWVPESKFEGVKSDDKLIAKKLFYYNTNYQSVEYMHTFRVFSAAIPVGDIRPISINSSTTK